MHRGFIPLYRKVQEHPFYKEKRVFSKFEAWLDLVMEARHKKEPEEIIIKSTIVKCGYGQSVKSLRTWGSRWGWTAKRVSRFFILLEKMEQIRHENVTVTTRITILNYDKYNMVRHKDVTRGKHKGNTRETQGKHDWDTNNNVNHVNHDNNEKNILPENKFSDPIIDFCNSAFEYLKKEHGKSFPKDTKIDSWYDCIDKLIRLDGFTLDEIKIAIRWGMKDSFWSAQIISLAGLRSKKNSDLTKFQKLYNAEKNKFQLNNGQSKMNIRKL